MNSNTKFTGFSPEELAAEPETPKEEPIVIAESDNIPCNEILPGEKSPENGQGVGGWTSYNVKFTSSKPPKKHKPKKPSGTVAATLAQQQIYYDKALIPNLKASPFDPANEGWHMDTLKADDVIGSPSEAWTDQYSLSADDIKKAAAALKAAQQAHQAQVNAKLDAVTYYSYPWGSNDYQLAALQKEASYWKSQTEEAKEIIKQLSGEPGEFIYIHPFDLYELLNSFVIPVSLNVDQDMKDIGFIEINGKKYKQSTMMPIVSKNSVVDASKYNKTDWSNCDVCNGTTTGHICDKHLPSPNQDPYEDFLKPGQTWDK